ncbi:MAG: signal peptidase I [Candidatus Tectomicrobia bacterium]|nr:signal peptidase I [Candidatus Tectomicrobia bacterium]
MSAGFRLYRVQGQSMAPALLQGDYVLVRAFRNPARRPPRRGDIIAFAMTEGSGLKRVVGLPGERLVFTEGMLLVDGDRLLEPYLGGLPSYLGLESREFALASGEFFVMGDNRTHSTDSRHFGPVRCSQIEGAVACRLWRPLRRGRNVP